MERDFMGLNSKDSVIIVKEEAFDGFKESVFTKNSAAHWPFSVGVDAFERSKNHQIGEIQKSVGVRQGGAHYSMATYPIQQNSYSMQVINDAKQAVPISMSHPFFRTPYGGQPVKQQPVSAPSIGSFLAGTTEPWNSSKASCVPAQLTIFYGGMVNVYDDISPEKAQAIMFLAGNGTSSSTPQPRAHTQLPVYTSQPVNVQPGPAISSPMSVSSHPLGLFNKEETGSGSVAPVSKVDSPRVNNSVEVVMQSAVPQARKASLARFLEKRKERTMASAPYNIGKELMNSGSSSMNVVTIAEN